jgi:hypothetical protein
MSVGECKPCADLQRRAQAELKSRGEEIAARVESKLEATEVERKRRIEAALAPIVSRERERIASELRHKDRGQFEHEERTATLAEIVAQLRAEAGQ